MRASCRSLGDCGRRNELDVYKDQDKEDRSESCQFADDSALHSWNVHWLNPPACHQPVMLKSIIYAPQEAYCRIGPHLYRSNWVPDSPSSQSARARMPLFGGRTGGYHQIVVLSGWPTTLPKRQYVRILGAKGASARDASR